MTWFFQMAKAKNRENYGSLGAPVSDVRMMIVRDEFIHNVAQRETNQ